MCLPTKKLCRGSLLLNPQYTLTLPHYQMAAGIYDIFNHICEQYFSGEDDNVSDYISEGLMRSVIHAGRIANKDPQNYEARSNLMWAATWALNTLVSRGKSTDWMVHMLGQSVGAYTNATHGMTLAAVSLPYYRHILPFGVQKFKRFAVHVWDVNTAGKSDEQIAKEGLAAMESWMKELGLVMNISELGATPEMIEGIAGGTLIMNGGYKVLDRMDEIVDIFEGESGIKSRALKEGGSLMPKGSEELTNARKEEIIDACRFPLRDQELSRYHHPGYRGENLVYPHLHLQLLSQQGGDLPGPAPAGTRGMDGGSERDFPAVWKAVCGGICRQTGPFAGKTGMYAQTDVHEHLRYGGQQPSGKSGGLQKVLCKRVAGCHVLPGKVFPLHDGRQYSGIFVCPVSVSVRRLSVYVPYRKTDPSHEDGTCSFYQLFHL